jgi:pantoate--beta-alanine ligase
LPNFEIHSRLKIFSTKTDLSQYLQQRRESGKSVGLVPTMGALHEGHLSLIRQAQRYTDEVVCSIFVNPTQFTDPADLEKYPRPITTDIQQLEAVNCNVLFHPEVDEMYAANEHWHLNIGELENLLEGKFRPGHYQGVTQVVYKLFDIVKPDFAFFGQKDYQQYLVIQKMVELMQLQVKLIMCPIEREVSGLAMSSRNIHLSADDAVHALVLFKTLNWVKQHFADENIAGIKQNASQMIDSEPGVKLDYLEIADGITLRSAGAGADHIIALVAAKVGNTRLIDNMIIR